MSTPTTEAAPIEEAVASLTLDATPAPPATDVTVRVFVGDIAPITTEASFRTYFEQWGEVSQAVVKHPSPGFDRPRSYGFITVIGEETAEKILNATHVIDGHTVAAPERAKPARGEKTRTDASMNQGPGGGGMPGAKVDRAHRDADNNGGGGGRGWKAGHNGNPHHTNAGGAAWDVSSHGGNGNGAGGGAGGRFPANVRKIFVGGLSSKTEESTLQAYFSQFGTLSDVVVMTEGATRRPRGFGFVTFLEPSAVIAVTSSRYHPVDGRLVEVKPAVPREQMIAMERAHEAEQAAANGGALPGMPGLGGGGLPAGGGVPAMPGAVGGLDPSAAGSGGADHSWYSAMGHGGVPMSPNGGAGLGYPMMMYPGGQGAQPAAGPMPTGVPYTYNSIMPLPVQNGVPVYSGYTPGVVVGPGGKPDVHGLALNAANPMFGGSAHLMAGAPPHVGGASGTVGGGAVAPSFAGAHYPAMPGSSSNDANAVLGVAATAAPYMIGAGTNIDPMSGIDPMTSGMAGGGGGMPPPGMPPAGMAYGGSPPLPGGGYGPSGMVPMAYMQPPSPMGGATSQQQPPLPRSRPKASSKEGGGGGSSAAAAALAPAPSAAAPATTPTAGASATPTPTPTPAAAAAEASSAEA